MNEVNARSGKSLKNSQITVIGSKACISEHDTVQFFTPKKIGNDTKANLRLHCSDIIIVGSDCYPEIADLLPVHSIIRNGTIETEEVTANRMLLHVARQGEESFHDKHPMHENNLLTEWTYQLSWRLNRSYELKVSKNEDQKERLEKQINEYLPQSQDVSKRLEEIRSIALPSVLECLQYGFATGRMLSSCYPRQLWTRGFPSKALPSRFSRINFQHRMHPDISSFSRKEFYDDEALIDADTLELRNANFPFSYRSKQPRNTWIDVSGAKGGYSVNHGEINAIKAELELFIDYSRNNKPTDSRRDSPEQWEIAILSPYQAQRKALVNMVQKLSGLDRFMRFNLAEMEDPHPSLSL